MDATKKAADREYVDRFFHGVASKLMTHPYFSKFANQANMSADVPASAAQLDVVLRAVAVKKAEAAAEANAKQLATVSAQQNVVRTAVSLDQYKANMEQVRELFKERSELLQELRKFPKDSNTITAIQDIDRHIMAVYASGKPQGEYINKIAKPSSRDSPSQQDPSQQDPSQQDPSQQAPSQQAPSQQAPSQQAPSQQSTVPYNPLQIGVPQRKPIQILPPFHNANVSDALRRIAEIYNQKARQLQDEVDKDPTNTKAALLNNQITALLDDAKSVVKETPQKQAFIDLFKPYHLDNVDRPNLSDEELAAIIARKHEPSPFSTRLAPQSLQALQAQQPSSSNGGRIQRRRSVKRGKINKNKRPQ